MSVMLLDMETAKLIETVSGYEVRCPECNALILRTSDKRAAYLNSQKVLDHLETHESKTV